MYLHPGRLTWEVWKISFLSEWMICRFHVNLPGCSFSDISHPSAVLAFKTLHMRGTANDGRDSNIFRHV